MLISDCKKYRIYKGNTVTTYIFDLDGTIITNGKPLHCNLAENIISLANSARVIFASARPVRDMLPLLPRELHDCLMVGCNGAMAWQQGECLFSNRFDNRAAEMMIGLLQQHQVPYVLDGHWSFSTSQTAHTFHDYMRTLTDSEIPESELVSQGVSKILILDGEFRAKTDAFLQQNGFEFSLHHHRHENIFDITPRQENKYLALKTLGVDFNRSIAFGNDSNDFEMLNNAGISIFTGEPHYYVGASHYCKTEQLPALLREFSVVQA
nr:HAD hydrolase family protein [Pantoea coffeiphila]